MGYYASITFFPHAHILNGVTIVHSHSFISGTAKNPVNHQHTDKGFMLIQLLSNILLVISFIAILIESTAEFIKRNDLTKNDVDFTDLSFLFSNGLRAPPNRSLF